MNSLLKAAITGAITGIAFTFLVEPYITKPLTEELTE